MKIFTVSKRPELFGEIGERNICHFIQGFWYGPNTEQTFTSDDFIPGGYGYGVYQPGLVFSH